MEVIEFVVKLAIVTAALVVFKLFAKKFNEKGK